VSRFRRAIARTIGLPLALLAGQVLRLSGRKLGVVVLYHGVGDPRGDPERELVPRHGTRLFEQQLRHLKARYRLVDAADLLAASRSRGRGQRFPAAVTFDDDLASHARVALPILVRLRVPATFFLSGASLSTPFAFWWERLEAAVEGGIDDIPSVVRGRSPDDTRRETIREMASRIEAMRPEDRDVLASELDLRLGPCPTDAGMRAEDVGALVAGGMSIGFHTRRHDTLTLLGNGALDQAMQHGRQELEEVVGARIATIAYPHGRADGRVAVAAGRAGFVAGFTGAGRAVRETSEPLLVPRIVPYHRSVGQFALQLVLQLLSARGKHATT
jgi:peptidoglycan/xylan/chitin deacetylase (PgdA/CDA1 family)